MDGAGERGGSGDFHGECLGEIGSVGLDRYAYGLGDFSCSDGDVGGAGRVGSDFQVIADATGGDDIRGAAGGDRLGSQVAAEGNCPIAGRWHSHVGVGHYERRDSKGGAESRGPGGGQIEHCHPVGFGFFSGDGDDAVTVDENDLGAVGGADLDIGAGG